MNQGAPREPASVPARLGLPPRIAACLFDLDVVVEDLAALLEGR